MKFSTHFKLIFTAFLLLLHLGDIYANPPTESNNKNDNKKSPSSGATGGQKNSEKQSDGKIASTQSNQSKQGNNKSNKPMNQSTQSKEQSQNIQPENKGTQSKESHVVQEQPTENVKSHVKLSESQPENKAVQSQSPQNKQGNSQSSQGDSAPATTKNSWFQQKDLINIRSNFSYTHRLDIKETAEEKKDNNNTKNKVAVDESVLFTYYSYQINKENRAKIANSQAVIGFKFGIKPFEFEDLSKLPSRKCWEYFRIFICKHNKTVMVRIKITDDGKPYHYYYAVDAETKKFRNIGIGSLDEKQEIDENGLKRHYAPGNPTSEEYSKKLEQVWPKIFDRVCKTHENPSAISMSPPLEISVAPPEKQNKKEGKGAKGKNK